MVFERRIGGEGEERTFGVSRLLYRSDVLMYDRESESLWSQLAMKAVSGPLVGVKLAWVSSEHMTWKAWREKSPHGAVLSTDTGYARNYAGGAYASYFASDKTMFPVPQTRTELPNRTLRPTRTSRVGAPRRSQGNRRGWDAGFAVVPVSVPLIRRTVYPSTGSSIETILHYRNRE